MGTQIQTLLLVLKHFTQQAVSPCLPILYFSKYVYQLN